MNVPETENTRNEGIGPTEGPPGLERGMEHVFLAPHLDDVVLSCGGQIWQLTRRGQKPWVITVFAGLPETGAEAFPFARYQHRLWGTPPLPVELRRAEDVTACVRLGVLPERVIHLDFPDAVYRHTRDGHPLYSSDEAIFGALHPADRGLSRHVADALTPYVGGQDVLLVAPAGVGRHVDHQIVRRAAEHVEALGARLVLYEELPYAEEPESFAHGPVEGWHPCHVPLREGDMAAKIRAALYYQTQIPVLYGDALALGERLRGHAARHAPPGVLYVERRWSRNPGGEK